MTQSEIQKRGVVRTTKVSGIQESLIRDRGDAADPLTVVCKDCKSSSPIHSLIPVDALHVQCPFCLFVFFREGSEKKMG